ncbi:hypothetical protein GQ651_05410 [Alphaproteobacteria bacterium GH1-50]|uniref:Uncharacterized protein n=1 Tax=Kangsaoukella pontilimi TaxID=2691042 RepID=A0A7C9ND87_9RHOB|nr:hypothetical protein [Kangsaoukella pontilimi]MXQ07279.1 hypothetical protein [Kangsaoukella pontilimi]
MSVIAFPKATVRPAKTGATLFMHIAKTTLIVHLNPVPRSAAAAQPQAAKRK